MTLISRDPDELSGIDCTFFDELTRLTNKWAFTIVVNECLVTN